MTLMPVLNLLVQPDRVNPWLRSPLIQALTLLPLRPRGVQHTIEFVLSVHPSTNNGDSAGPGRGANISLEGLNAASKLLSSPPASLTPEKWFAGIAPQLLSLLDGEGEPGMDKAAAYVIGFGILGRRQYGAPGSPGWNALVLPLLQSIDPSMMGQSLNSSKERVTEIGVATTLVNSCQLAKGLLRLRSLVTSHPHPSLTKRLLRPLVLPLWALSSWPSLDPVSNERFSQPAKALLHTFLQLASSSPQIQQAGNILSHPGSLMDIVRNLTFEGRSVSSKVCWTYCATNDGIEIRANDNMNRGIVNIEAVQHKSHEFVKLLEISCSAEEISPVFLSLCNKWLSNSARERKPSILIQSGEAIQEDPTVQLIEAQLMQIMMDSVPDKLVSDSKQVLGLVAKVLQNFDSTDPNGEDSAGVALSLLNIVLTSPSFNSDDDTEARLKTIREPLRIISKQGLDISSTARNLLMLLKFHKAMSEPALVINPNMDQQEEDRKSYKLAMSYLTSTESPPPVRVQGLDLLSKLVERNSPVLDIPALLVLYASLLQDDEDYIYLRVIRSFTQISRLHPKSVLRDLIERYVDVHEDLELDARLRLGEALLQVMQNSSHALSNDTSTFVCQGLLSVAGRRGKRAKTEEEQMKRARVKRKRVQEAEEVWGGPVPQVDEALGGDLSQEDGELISQIVSGWESKRGSEDVRIRASSLSILGPAIELNAVGIGPSLIAAAVDLSIHILTLEPEPEKGILRRSAILLILSLAHALETARTERKKIGFGFVGQSLDDILRVLHYVESSDNDGLVRQHAKDVIESLQTWQINSLVPNTDSVPEIQHLAGLSINPSLGNDRPRPKIEEIE
ncbi:hypothetical protein PVAG01_08013 [Phlyctema vagabunda]|uniref:RNA polymerase II assembly factor Rtp1 C-terminal domain-containing protein n=1 Tax=Phlyctema vagabunda TaxID=108571 RepID=A0ABR4PEJ9_9HELO